VVPWLKTPSRNLTPLRFRVRAGVKGMLQKIFEVVQAFVQVLTIVTVVVEIASDTTGTKGAEKKAQAIAKAKELFPPERLGAFAGLYDQLAGLLIDAIVAYANSRGFFSKSGQ
jgi:hypothetical protein